MLMPAHIIRSMMLFGILVTLLAIWVGTRQPGTGIGLEDRNGHVIGVVDQERSAPVSLWQGGRGVALEPMDIVADSDVFDVSADLQRFHQRQTVLATMMRAPGAVLVVGTARHAVQRHRGILGNPARFWIILLPGLAAVAISAVVLAADPASLANRMVAVSGVLFSLLTASIAVVATRDLAIDGDLYRSLATINEVGSIAFAVVMAVLFCIYPRRIVPARWLWPATVGIFAVMMAICVGHWLEWLHSPGDGIIGGLVWLRVAIGGTQTSVVFVFLALCIALAVQFRVSRKDPLARAALIWFGLSVAIGAGGFILLLTLPNLLDTRAPVDVSVGFLLLTLIYVGLAFGLLRYRLFAAKAWSFRVLLIVLGTLALWVIDAALIYGLGLDQGPALGMAVILAGLVYQPARARLATLLSGGDRLRNPATLTVAIDVAFAAPGVRTMRWQALLQRLFDPLEITVGDGDPSRASRLDGNGVVMLVPDPEGVAMIRLAYPGAGTRLFSPADLALVDELATLCRRVTDALRSYDRGAADERHRMAQDLHDDIGARLLSGIHIAEGPVRSLLQDALRDIRTLVTGLIGETAPLSRVVADIRHETASRLEAARIELDWPILTRGCDQSMPYRCSKAITSAIREAVSNTIRHADAAHMTVRIDMDGAMGTIDIADDGCGIAPDRPAGNGLNGIAGRMAGIGGRVQFDRTGPGTRITLHWPLDQAGSQRLSNEDDHAR